MVAAPVADKDNHRVDMLFATGGEGGIVDESLDNTRDSIGDAKTSQRRTIRFDTLLQQFSDQVPKVINYLSLDIEGAELLAMSSFPWETHRIDVLTVERPSYQLHALLYTHGLRYVMDHGSFGDQLFVHSDFISLSEALAILLPFVPAMCEPLLHSPAGTFPGLKLRLCARGKNNRNEVSSRFEEGLDRQHAWREVLIQNNWSMRGAQEELDLIDPLIYGHSKVQI